jgi:dCTP deaminase
MILTGHEIQREISKGRIRIEPFRQDQVSPNSYDLTLGATVWRPIGDVLDCDEPLQLERIPLPPEGRRFDGQTFLLASTQERIAVTDHVPLIHGRSGTARAGVFSHVTGDLLPVGFDAHPRLQLFLVLQFKLKPGMHIGQVSFWTVDRKVDLP